MSVCSLGPALRKLQTEREKDEEEQHQDEEQPRIISKYMDGTRVVALYCDGSRAFADAYSPGKNGFAMAHWLADDACMETELPNRLCDGGQLVFPKAATRVQKKPSAVEVVCLDEKDEDDDSDEPCDSGPEAISSRIDDGKGGGDASSSHAEATSTTRIRVCKGHGTDYTLLFVLASALLVACPRL